MLSLQTDSFLCTCLAVEILSVWKRAEGWLLTLFICVYCGQKFTENTKFGFGFYENTFTPCKSWTETCWDTFGSIRGWSVSVMEADEGPTKHLDLRQMQRSRVLFRTSYLLRKPNTVSLRDMLESDLHASWVGVGEQLPRKLQRYCVRLWPRHPSDPPHGKWSFQFCPLCLCSRVKI